MKQNIMGYFVDSDSIEGCVDQIFDAVAKGRRDCRWLACLNPHSYAVASRDTAFATALRAAQWLVPDGVGIVFAGRVLGQRVQEKITGADIFESVMARLNTTHGSVFFLGGTKKTLELIREKLALDYPDIHLAGTFSPPFKPTYSDAELDEMIGLVNRSGAQVLWVGMTAPKQEKWIFFNRDRLSVSFSGAIGAVFDFYAGQVKRSAPVFRGVGLEWLPRLLQQPRRLWRRMFVSAPIFLFDVMWWWFGRLLKKKGAQ